MAGAGTESRGSRAPEYLITSHNNMYVFYIYIYLLSGVETATKDDTLQPWY